jgi:peptidoglycan/LPS O-acetylase OafA/YrhL
MSTRQLRSSADVSRYALLDPLRGIAALWVFFFHLSKAPGWSTWPTIRGLFDLGHLGVPMFFVISGFCITAAARSTPSTMAGVHEFVRRRFRRIYPPFWCSVVVVCATPFTIEALSWLKTGTYAWPSADNLNYGFLRFDLMDWFGLATLVQVFRVDPAAAVSGLQIKFTTVNAVYWTLAIEVQFYLVMAAAIWTGRRIYPTLAVLTALSVATMAIPGADAIGLFLPYWPMFAVGVALFAVFEAGWTPSRVMPTAAPWFSGVVCIVAVGLLLRVAGAGVQPSESWFALAVGAVAWGAEGLNTAVARMQKRRNVVALAMTWLGAMSYSVYLLHARVQFLSIQFVRQVLPQGSILFDLSVVGLTLVICAVFYRLCEKPFIGRSSRSSAAGRPAPLAVPTLAARAQ